MKKEELDNILKKMCQRLESLDRTGTVGKDFLKDLETITQEANICSYIIEKMAKEDIPLLDEVLVILIRDENMPLTEKEIVKLTTVPTTIYCKDDFIECILDSIDEKLSKTTIRKIVKNFGNDNDFLSDYLDLLWDKYLDEDDQEIKRKKKLIFEDAREWFFDEKWL